LFLTAENAEKEKAKFDISKQFRQKKEKE